MMMVCKMLICSSVVTKQNFNCPITLFFTSSIPMIDSNRSNRLSSFPKRFLNRLRAVARYRCAFPTLRVHFIESQKAYSILSLLIYKKCVFRGQKLKNDNEDECAICLGEILKNIKSAQIAACTCTRRVLFAGNINATIKK